MYDCHDALTLFCVALSTSIYRGRVSRGRCLARVRNSSDCSRSLQSAPLSAQLLAARRRQFARVNLTRNPFTVSICLHRVHQGVTTKSDNAFKASQKIITVLEMVPYKLHSVDLQSAITTINKVYNVQCTIWDIPAGKYVPQGAIRLSVAGNGNWTDVAQFGGTLYNGLREYNLFTLNMEYPNTFQGSTNWMVRFIFSLSSLLASIVHILLCIWACVHFVCSTSSFSFSFCICVLCCSLSLSRSTALCSTN